MAWLSNQTWCARGSVASAHKRVRVAENKYKKLAVYDFGDSRTSGVGGAREPEPEHERFLFIGAYQK